MPSLYHRRQFLVRRFLSRVIRTVSAATLSIAILGLILTFGPVGLAELNYRFKQLSPRQSPTTSSQAPASGFGLLLGQPVEAQIPADIQDPYFWIKIPKIGASSKIIANVDPSNRRAYLSALSQGVAHAAGTNFPGAGERIYLFAHSTDSPVNIARYNAVFYLLRELKPGDQIEIYFMGRKHLYQVKTKEILPADDLKYFAKSNTEELILQTCWPPGTTWKRLVIVAKPYSTKEEINN